MLNRKEIDEKIMDYVNTKKPQLGRFYLLLKIHKRRSNVPGRPTISNNGILTENISSFLDFNNSSNNTTYIRRCKGLCITIKSTL